MKKSKEMERPLRRARLLMSSTRLIPHLILMLFADRNGLLKADLTRWAENLHFNKPSKLYDFVILFLHFMTFTPEFRNLFCFRLGTKAKLLNWMCPCLNSLLIDANYVGPGFFIAHGIGTLVSAESIGTNCWINQQVTVGYSNDTDRPTIGDNVKISPGAVIIGKVKIGDNATIGPNTVVFDDVPSGATVLGVPARIIWMGNSVNWKSRKSIINPP